MEEEVGIGATISDYLLFLGECGGCSEVSKAAADRAVGYDGALSSAVESYANKTAATYKTSLEESALSWRLDPRISMSDWTIVVVSPGKTIGKNYHVHKSVLAFGPRRSVFFAENFREQKERWNAYKDIMCVPDPSKEEQTAGLNYKVWQNIIRLELEPLAAQVFPSVLDFIYDPSAELAINTENATAHHVLGQRFKINALQRRAFEFLQADLSFDTITVYCKHANILNDKVILRAAEPIFAQNLFKMQETNMGDILEVATPLFFLSVMNIAVNGLRNEDERRSYSRGLSILVSVYCSLHQKDLSARIYLSLTDERYLPVVEPRAAKTFLELQERICGPDQVTSLTLRCVAVLSELWDKDCVNEAILRRNGFDPDMSTLSADSSVFGGSSYCSMVRLPNLSPDAMNEFVSGSFVNAKKRIMVLERQLEEMQSKLNEQSELVRAKSLELKYQLESVRSKLDDHGAATLRGDNDSAIESYLEDRVVELEQELEDMQVKVNGNNAKTTTTKKT